MSSEDDKTISLFMHFSLIGYEKIHWFHRKGMPHRIAFEINNANYRLASHSSLQNKNRIKNRSKWEQSLAVEAIRCWFFFCEERVRFKLQT